MTGENITQESVTSQDGTRIGFLRQGSGPGLVLVQGAMGTAYNYRDLAEALSPNFTVYLPDRRGRGMSPKTYDKGHTITRDVEDIDAILEATGASWVYGLSSGAMVTLEATRTLPRITRAAVYEPPFYPAGILHEGIRRLNTEIENDDLPAALVSALLTAETAPTAIKLLPRPIARLLADVVLRVDARKSGPAPKLRDLLPGIRFDFSDVAGMDGKMETMRTIDKPMLLLSGTKSPAFLRQSIRTLETILRHSQYVEFDSLAHDGSWNSGNPKAVATVLCEFFV